MRSTALLFSILAALAALRPEAAGAVTLEQYFFGFSDRERGVYLTGVLDLFAADSSRDPEYRHCVTELGPKGIHEAVSRIVKEDPRLLSFDAALWILYEASRQCNKGADGPTVPDPRSMLQTKQAPASKRAGVPELAAAPIPPGEPAAQDVPEHSEPWRPLHDWRYVGGALLLMLLAGGLVAFVAGSLRARRRHAGRKRQAPRPHHSSPTSEHG